MALVGDKLYVAMAGTHQIWVIDLTTQRTTSFAGTGREAARGDSIADGAFGRPSGLATDGKHLYVASSEASCIQDINIADSSLKFSPAAANCLASAQTTASERQRNTGTRSASPSARTGRRSSSPTPLTI